MSKVGIEASAFGLVANLLLFFLKLYIGVSSNSLTIYCDAINNMTDTISCVIAILGFFLVKKLSERKGSRVQSLCSFVIGLIITVFGVMFVYNGINRLMYPVPVAYATRFSLLLLLTIGVKAIMGLVYCLSNKREPSPVLKALILDSFLDCGVTAGALIGFYLVAKMNFSVDGVFCSILGLVITIGAVKTTIEQAKTLVND